MELMVGTVYHGFLCQKEQELPDCSGTLYTLIHEKTGAQLVWLKRQDMNKTFAIAFKTIPSDDTGVFHMLEHSVLNGSEKYPLKEPFVELLKSSMQTFLNAFTAPDKTMYPVSSRNTKDFMNLVSVYMDAVFHPAIYTNPNIFYQEGWHYEIRNEAEEPAFKGVVLNEMKGAFSSVDETLVDELNRMLFPDNCYQYVSGGNPEHITDLTYEQFLATHKKFYHPSNSRVWLDGDMDIDAVLAYINDEYFSHYTKEDMNFDIPMQEVRDAEVHRCTYEIAEEDAKEDRTQISLAKIISSFDDVEKNMAWTVLSTVLTSNNEALLKKNIIDARLGEDVELELYNGIQQPWSVLTVRNTNEGSYEEVRKVIRDTAETLVTEGLDHEDLTATLNQMEFKYREKHEPAGLMYADRAMNSWLYDGDPAIYLNEGSLFEDLRSKINEGYCEELLKEFLLDDAHIQAVIAVPSYDVKKERLAREEKKLHDAKVSWKDGVKDYVALNQKLDAWQAEPDSKEALASLPKLSIDDIAKEPFKFPYEETEVENVPVLIHPSDDSEIVYMNLYFNLAGIKREELPSLGFWSTLPTNLRTKQHTLQQLQEEIKKYMGDMGVYLDAYSLSNTPESCYPIIGVTVSALKKNLDHVVSLLLEIMQDTLFEKETILPLLKQDYEDFRQELIMSGQGDAMRRAAAHHSAEGVFREYVGGYASGMYEKDLEDGYDEKIDTFIQECEMYADVLFSKARLTLSITDNAPSSIIKDLIDGLHTYDANRAKVHYPLLTSGNESLVIPAGIAYSAVNTSVVEQGFKYDDRMRVIAHILTYSWLWNEVRVKGGAYGTGFSVNLNGNIGGYSYRDPDPHNAVEAIKHSADYLETLNDIDLDQMIIGTIASGEPLLSPASKVRVSDSMYFRAQTYESRKQARENILSMKKEDIQTFTEVFRKSLEHSTICIIGSKEKVDACKDLELNSLKQI